MSVRQERAVGLRDHDELAACRLEPPPRRMAVALARLVDQPRGRLARPPPRCRAAALLSTTTTSSTTPVAKKPLDHLADGVALRVGREHDRYVLAVPHRGRGILGNYTRPPLAMIAFGSSITKPRSSGAARARASRRAARARSARLRRCRRSGSIFRSYNALLDRAAAREDLEALVLVHQDAELVDAELCATLRAALRDPDVGRRRLRRRDRRPQHRLVGGVGDARLVRQPLRRSTAAATSSRSRGRGRTRRRTRRPARSRRSTASRSRSRPGPSATSASTSRCGEFHGYDLDYCLQVREAGPQGRDRRLPRDPPPPARDDPGPGGVGPRAHRRRGEVGRPHAGHRQPARATGASGRCGPRPSATRRWPIAQSKALEREARAARAAARAGRDARERLVAADRAAAAARRLAPPAMIVFGSSIVDPEAYRRFAAPGHPRRGRARLRDRRVRGGGERLPQLQPAARRRRARATSSRRSCSSTSDVEIDRPGLLRPGPRGARAIPAVAVAGWMGARRRAQHRLVGGRGQLRAGRCSATTSTAAAQLAAFALDGRSTTPPSEVDAVGGRLLVLSPWAVRNAPLRRGARLGPRLRRRLLPARAREAGRQGGHRAPSAPSTTTALELVAERDIWIEGHIRLRGEVGRADAREPSRRRSWRARARRAEAERDAARTVAYSSRARVDARVLPLERELDAMTESRVLAPHRAAARAQPGAAPQPGAATLRAPGGSRPSTTTGLLASRYPTRLRSRESRSATANALESSSRRSSASWRARRSRCPPAARRAARGPAARWWTRLASSRSSTGLRSNGSRSARELVRRTGRRGCHDHAEAEEHRHDGQADAGARVRRSPRPRSARRCAGRPRGSPSAGRAARPASSARLPRHDARPRRRRAAGGASSGICSGAK